MKFFLKKHYGTSLINPVKSHQTMAYYLTDDADANNKCKWINSYSHCPRCGYFVKFPFFSEERILMMVKISVIRQMKQKTIDIVRQAVDVISRITIHIMTNKPVSVHKPYMRIQYFYKLLSQLVYGTWFNFKKTIMYSQQRQYVFDQT